ncbi:MAG: YceI family protein [Pseudomonadota bacterium]
MKRLRTLLLLLLLAGCASGPPPAPSAPPAGASAPLDWYRQAQAAGQNILRVDAGASLITITVRRAGALARLGHEHIVACRTLEGFVAPDAGRADFQFRLDQLSVDEMALRRDAHFDTHPSDEAIAATRRNMLGPVLEAERFPLVSINAQRLDAQRGGAQTLRLAVTLHGVTRLYQSVARIDTEPAGTLRASGAIALLQSDFGIVPMSVLGGAIAVRDQLELNYQISARRVR